MEHSLSKYLHPSQAFCDDVNMRLGGYYDYCARVSGRRRPGGERPAGAGAGRCQETGRGNSSRDTQEQRGGRIGGQSRSYHKHN